MGWQLPGAVRGQTGRDWKWGQAGKWFVLNLVLALVLGLSGYFEDEDEDEDVVVMVCVDSSQMEAQKVGTVSGFKFEVSGSLLETRNLEPETRNVSDFLRSHPNDW